MMDSESFVILNMGLQLVTLIYLVHYFIFYKKCNIYTPKHKFDYDFENLSYLNSNYYLSSIMTWKQKSEETTYLPLNRYMQEIPRVMLMCPFFRGRGIFARSFV